MSNTSKGICLLLLLATIASFYFATIRPGEVWTEDSALYVQHAKNLSTGEPYGKAQFVYQADRWNTGPKAYPPGYPVILAAVYRWHGLDFRLMKLETVAFFLLSLVVMYYAFREDVEFYSCLAVIAIVAFNPFFWGYKEAILSDMPFLFFAYGALFLLDSPWFWEEGSGHSRIFRRVLTGIAFYIAYATRVVGIVLLPTVFVLSLIRARRITRAAWAALSVSVGLIILEAALNGDFTSYLRVAHTNGESPIRRAAATVHYYVGVSSTLWDNGHSKIARLMVFTILTALAAAGLVFQVRRRIRAWEIFTVFYVPLLFIWEEDRYLFPLIPLFVFYFVKGAEGLGGWKTRKVRAALVAAVAVIVGLTYAGEYSVINFKQPVANAMDTAEAHQFYQFVLENVSDHDVIELPAARTLSLFTDRHAYQYHPLSPVTDSQIWHDLQVTGVTYVTSTAADEPFWVRFMKANQHCLDTVFSNSGFQLYRIRKTASTGEQSCEPPAP